MNNETLKKKLEEFINLFESETEEIKGQVNYNSTLNITNQLLKFHHNKESEKYKVLIAEYIDELKTTDLPTGKMTSLELYNKYILKTGNYLVHERDFRHKGTNKIKYIFVGIVLDVLVYYFFKSKLPFYLPIFILIFTFLGIRRTKKMITDKKAFGRGF
jgi:predicted restriction endonuclease